MWAELRGRYAKSSKMNLPRLGKLLSEQIAAHRQNPNQRRSLLPDPGGWSSPQGTSDMEITASAPVVLNVHPDILRRAPLLR
jgi:hypothetical protein